MTSWRGLGGARRWEGLHLELGDLRAVGPLDSLQQHHQRGDGDADHPGAVGELGDGDDDQDDQGNDPAGAVDHQAVAPARLAQAQMPSSHAGLGEGEGEDHADGVQRDQLMGVGPKRNHQEDGRGRQHQDAVGVDQPVAALAELAGQDGIVSGEGGQQREAGE
jgi:hypothetical protein